jgi:hypothetical protein
VVDRHVQKVKMRVPSDGENFEQSGGNGYYWVEIDSYSRSPCVPVRLALKDFNMACLIYEIENAHSSSSSSSSSCSLSKSCSSFVRIASRASILWVISAISLWINVYSQYQVTKGIMQIKSLTLRT